MSKKKKQPGLPFNDELDEPFTPRMSIDPPAPEPPPPPRDDETWTPPVDPESPALDDLDEETHEAIHGVVTREMVAGLIENLDATPRHVEHLRRDLVRYPWFPTHVKRDTQLRRIRTIRDAAVYWKHPVCSTNKGYFLGSREQLLESAIRARKLAIGSDARASRLEYLARNPVA